MVNLDVIMNWITIPFKANFDKRKIETLSQCTNLVGYVKDREGSNVKYFSPESINNGLCHDTLNQVVNQSLYMYLYDLEEDIKYGMDNFLYWNLHAGRGITNGISFHQDGILFSNANTNTETLASLCLYAASGKASGSFLEMFEVFLLEQFVDRGNKLFYLKNPGNNPEYNKQLSLVMYRPEKVVLEIPKTYCGLGCSSDNAVVMLAVLKVIEKVFKSRYYKHLYTEFVNKHKFNLKARFSSNSPATIIALQALLELDPENNLYHELIDLRLNGNQFRDYAFTKIIGKIE